MRPECFSQAGRSVPYQCLLHLVRGRGEIQLLRAAGGALQSTTRGLMDSRRGAPSAGMRIECRASEVASDTVTFVSPTRSLASRPCGLSSYGDGSVGDTRGEGSGRPIVATTSKIDRRLKREMLVKLKDHRGFV